MTKEKQTDKKQIITETELINAIAAALKADQNKWQEFRNKIHKYFANGFNNGSAGLTLARIGKDGKEIGQLYYRANKKEYKTINNGGKRSEKQLIE